MHMKDNQQVFKYIAIGFFVVFVFSMFLKAQSVVVLALAGFLAYKWYTLSEETKDLQRRYDICKNKAIEYEDRYRGLIDVDVAIKTSKAELDALKQSKKEQEDICDSLKEKLSDYRKKLSEYDEQFDFIEFGLYEPHFSFEYSETYKEKIKQVRNQQKEMFKNSLAIKVTKQILVDGDQKKGKSFTNKIIKLTGRAFNKECDVAVANVNWRNISKMERRIKSAYEDLNKLNVDNHVVITESYLKLKIDELHLAYEYQEKKQAEKEEQAEIRRKEKEEQKLLQEAQRLQAEEKKLQELLASVQAKANISTGEELAILQEKIERLGSELKAMQSESSRAKAMAEQTKLGYVYVISNIGSFGENIFKIGMTRRLDPNDRIKELGSASVPFYFDTHAMIFSEDAPALESKLQKAFDDKRVNRVNARKEYFNVTLDEIKKKVWEINPNIEFVDEAEAQEYRESMALQAKHEFRLSIDEDDNRYYYDDD